MWLLFAFSGPVLWAISTHIDKYLVEKYFRHSSVAVLLVFTSLIGIVMLPFIWWYQPHVLDFSAVSIAVIMASGILSIGSMLFYLQALQTEEASAVAPWFQASPLFGYFLAYLFLGETLSRPQIAGCLIIIAGAVLVSLDPSFRFVKIKTRLILLMLVCTFVLALSSVIFKFFAVQDEFWSTAFWAYAGEAIFGAGLLAIPAYFRQFRALLRTNTGAVLGVNASNELINLGGSLGVRYALLLAPLAIVQAIGSTMTLLVFLFGIVLPLLFPAFGREDMSPRNLLQKGASAVLIMIGVILINQ
jgi:drug/metabolite transporter (DMT)-like permease